MSSDAADSLDEMGRNVQLFPLHHFLYPLIPETIMLSAHYACFLFLEEKIFLFS